MWGNVLEGGRLSADVSDKFHQWNPTPRPLGGQKRNFSFYRREKKLGLSFGGGHVVDMLWVCAWFVCVCESMAWGEIC